MYVCSDLIWGRDIFLIPMGKFCLLHLAHCTQQDTQHTHAEHPGSNDLMVPGSTTGFLQCQGFEPAITSSNITTTLHLDEQD